MTTGPVLTPGHQANPSVAPRTELLEVNNLQKYFPIRGGLMSRVVANVKAVNDITFKVGKGEVVGLIGESGSGKTTAGRALLRLIEPTGGQVIFDGTDITKLSKPQMRDYRRQMQIIFQDPFASLNPRMTVREVIAEPLRLHGMAGGAGLDRRIDEVLGMAGLSSWHAGRYPHEFSGGQRQRIGIARALVADGRHILTDVVTSGGVLAGFAETALVLHPVFTQGLPPESGVPKGIDFEDAAEGLQAARDRGVDVRGAVVQRDDARLIANRLEIAIEASGVDDEVRGIGHRSTVPSAAADSSTRRYSWCRMREVSRGVNFRPNSAS